MPTHSSSNGYAGRGGQDASTACTLAEPRAAKRRHICSGGCTLGAMGSVGRVSLSCVDAPLSCRTPRCSLKIKTSGIPPPLHSLSSALSAAFLLHFCLINFSFLSLFILSCALYSDISRKLPPLCRFPPSSGSKENVRRRQGREASSPSYLLAFLTPPVCATLSFLPGWREGVVVVMKMLISLSPGGPDCSVVPLSRSCARALAAY